LVTLVPIPGIRLREGSYESLGGIKSHKSSSEAAGFRVSIELWTGTSSKPEHPASASSEDGYWELLAESLAEPALGRGGEGRLSEEAIPLDLKLEAGEALRIRIKPENGGFWPARLGLKLSVWVGVGVGVCVRVRVRVRVCVGVRVRVRVCGMVMVRVKMMFMVRVEIMGMVRVKMMFRV